MLMPFERLMKALSQAKLICAATGSNSDEGLLNIIPQFALDYSGRKTSAVALAEKFWRRLKKPETFSSAFLIMIGCWTVRTCTSRWSALIRDLSLLSRSTAKPSLSFILTFRQKQMSPQ